MGNALAVQTSFAGGEISAYAQGRFDLPTYKKSLNVSLNGLPIETEGWTRRPGSLFAGTSLAGAASRAIAFDFAEASPYSCVFSANGSAGSLTFRQGSAFVTTNDDQVISSISAASPAVIQTAGAHGWSNGDTTFGHGFGQGVPVLQNRQFKITVVDSTHFSLADAITGAPINGAALGGAFVGGSVSRLRVISSPYINVADLPNIRLVQTEGSPSVNNNLPFAYIYCAGYAIYKLSVTASPTSTAFATFTLAACVNGVDILDGPYLPPNTALLAESAVLQPSATTGTIALTPNVSGVFTAGNVGQLIRLFSQPAQGVEGQGYVVGDLITAFPPNCVSGFSPPWPLLGTYWACIQNTTLTNGPQYSPTTWMIAPAPAAYWTWGIITAVASNVATVTILGQDLVAVTNIFLFQMGLFGGENGWPICGTYHEGRVWMSGSAPNRIDGCVTDQTVPLVMSPTDIDNTVTDSNACSYTFNSPDANPIFWMIPDIQGIICGTQAGEWLVQATAANEPLTPTSVQAHRNTTVGCANIEPVRCELTIALVQKFKRKVMEYFADVFSGKLVAPNLSEFAMHLTTKMIAEIRFQHSVNPILWMRDNLGNLFGATYRRTSLFSSQKPDFIGWHRHTLGSGYSVQSITVGASSGGNLDALTLVTQDANGINYIEVLSDAFNEDQTLVNAIFVDQATKPTSWVMAAATTANPYGTITFNGLWHFNGKTVTVWAAGLDCGDYVVSNGSLTVPFGDSIAQGAADGIFTSQAWAANSVAWIGFNFTSQGQALPPVDPRDAGTQAGLGFAKVQRTQQFGAKLANAGPGGANGGVYFGGDFSDLHKATFKTPGGRKDLPQTSMFSGIHWDVLDDDYTFESMPCWQINRPYPFTLTAFGEFNHTQDR